MDWTRISQTVDRLLRSQAGLCVQFCWGGKSFQGCRTSLKREDVNSDEGLVVGDYRYSLLCPAAQFEGTYPQPRLDKVPVEGEEMRVLAWEADAVHACIRIDLGGLLA